MTTMYDRIGGEQVLRDLCQKFHALVVDDPLLSQLFAYSGEGHTEHLTAFLTEMFGGPSRYSTELGGIGGLYDAHLGLRISEEQRVRFVELMLAAAADAGLPDDDAFRTAFTRHIESGSRFSAKFSRPEYETAPKPRFPDVEAWTW